MNIKLNSRLSHEFKLPVHVPPAPCDAGLSAGATFAVHYKAALAPMAFKGLPVSDAHALAAAAQLHGAVKSNISYLASTLLANQIVGTLIGRQEVGPRAHGHRSLLVYGIRNPEAKQKLNAIKRRQFYRPVAPVVELRDVGIFFEIHETANGSPYMSFAPQLRAEFRDECAAVMHLDGTGPIDQLVRLIVYTFVSAAERGRKKSSQRSGRADCWADCGADCCADCCADCWGRLLGRLSGLTPGLSIELTAGLTTRLTTALTVWRPVGADCRA